MRTVTSLFLLLIAAPVVSAEPSLSISAMLDYSSGRYGTTTQSNSWYIPIAAEYKTGRFTTELTIPWVRVSSTAPGQVITGGPQRTPAPRAQQRPNVTSTSGLGDITLSGAYQLVQNHDAGIYLTPTAIVKFGTADEARGLGTGEMDYSGQIDAALVRGNWTWFGHAGYTVNGDPAGVSLDNTLYGRIGIDNAFEPEHSVGGYLDFEQAIARGFDERVEATAYLMGPAWEKTQYQIWARGGFTDASADWGAGVGLVWSVF